MVTQNMLRMYEGKEIFSEKFGEKIRFVTAFCLIKCLEQILTCALVSELPPSISTMIYLVCVCRYQIVVLISFSQAVLWTRYSIYTFFKF